MHRFFIDPRAIAGLLATLTGPEAHHLRDVLRLTAGDEVELFDGAGAVYQARIEQLGKEVRLAVISRQTFAPPVPSLCLGQGLLKGKKMELLVQKASELGVTTFIPFSSEHCAAPSPREAKLARWDKILLESCKQCGRAIPLIVTDLLDFQGVLAQGAGYETKIIFWEKETQNRLHDLPGLAVSRSIIALVGPEGGFSGGEADRAAAAGFIPVSLGRLTLRAETAAMAAMAVLQHLGGNL